MAQAPATEDAPAEDSQTDKPRRSRDRPRPGYHPTPCCVCTYVSSRRIHFYHRYVAAVERTARPICIRPVRPHRRIDAARPWGERGLGNGDSTTLPLSHPLKYFLTTSANHVVILTFLGRRVAQTSVGINTSVTGLVYCGSGFASAIITDR